MNQNFLFSLFPNTEIVSHVHLVKIKLDFSLINTFCIFTWRSQNWPSYSRMHFHSFNVSSWLILNEVFDNISSLTYVTERKCHFGNQILSLRAWLWKRVVLLLSETHLINSQHQSQKSCYHGNFGKIFVCLPPNRNLIWPLESEPNRWNGRKGYFLEKRISRNQLKDRKKTHMISGLHIVPSRRLNLLTNFHVDLVRKYRSVEMTTTFVFLIIDLRKTRPRLRVFEFDQLLSRGIRRTKYAL